MSPPRPLSAVVALAGLLLVAGCDGTGGDDVVPRRDLAARKHLHGAAPGAPRQPSPPGTTEASVVDGDTIRVLVEGVNHPVRLIGIDAPEHGDCMAAEAAGRLTELVDEGVRLESDVTDRDDHGRLLRYVHAGDVFVNELLVREGLALARRYEPDTSRAEELRLAQSAARAAGVGVWKSSACGRAATAGGLEIVAIRPDAAGPDEDNLNDEWVELANTGDRSLDLSGWTVRDEASNRYEFPSGFRLAAGATVRIRTGCGRDTATALFWCREGSAVWNNSGDNVLVLDPVGRVSASRSYPARRRTSRSG